jgi:hypothetical protein
MQNHFSKQDVDDYWAAATQSPNPAATDAIMRKVKQNVDKLPILEVREIKTLLNKFNDLFAYLNNLVRITDEEMNHFAFFT